MNFFQKTEITTVNANKLISLLPEDLYRLTKIEIKVFSNIEIKIRPCQSVFVTTGIFFNPFESNTHHIFFKGYENSCGMKIMKKLFFPDDVEELVVVVTNYSSEFQYVRAGMPLGKVCIQSNN